MNIGDRVKFRTVGGWYNSGIIRDMNEDSYLIEVDELGYKPPEDVYIPLPYYVRVLSCEEIINRGKNMTREEAIEHITSLYTDKWLPVITEKDKDSFNMAIQALRLLDKLDEMITEQIDISYDQVECQTLRWVLDKISEVEE